MKETDLLQTMDAKIWTDEFLRINPDSKDFGTMIGWFANSIMCGYDHAYWRLEKDRNVTLNFCAGLISTMDQFSNKHPEEIRDWILAEVQAIKDKDAIHE